MNSGNLNRSAWRLAELALCLCLGLSACAQLADPAGAQGKAVPAASAPGAPVVAKAGPAAAASAPAAAASAAPPGPLRPFADVVKDAKRSDGLFTLWQKDDKVWLELRPEDLNQPFFLSPKIKTGIGENFFFGGLLGFDERRGRVPPHPQPGAAGLAATPSSSPRPARPRRARLRRRSRRACSPAPRC